MKYILNPSVRFSPLSEGAHDPAVLCEIPAQGDSFLRYAVPVELVEMFKLFDGERETSEAIRLHCEIHPAKYNPEQLERFVSAFCVPKGLLANSAGEPVRPPSNQQSYLYVKKRIASQNLVYPIVRPLRFLFHKQIVAGLLPMFAVVHLVFYLWVAPAPAFNVNKLSGSQFLLATLLTVVAAVFHEMGHAAALCFNGSKRVEMGVGLYLYIPVLYTDVSDSWKLRPRQRAMVDVGGIYFHCICLVTFLLLFWWLRSPAILYAFFFVDVTIACSLNPFLRMDGYWLVADLFGILNLRKESVGLIKYWAYKFSLSKKQVRPPRITLKRNSLIALGVYAVLSTCFFVYLFAVVAYQVAFHLIPAYPRLIAEIVERAFETGGGSLDLLGSLMDAGWRALILLGCSFFLYRLIAKLLRYAISWARPLIKRLKNAVAADLANRDSEIQ